MRDRYAWQRDSTILTECTHQSGCEEQAISEQQIPKHILIQRYPSVVASAPIIDNPTQVLIIFDKKNRERDQDIACRFIAAVIARTGYGSLKSTKTITKSPEALIHRLNAMKGKSDQTKLMPS